MAGSLMTDNSPAEPEALKHLFSYLVNSMDTAAILPAAMSRGLITDRQRSECSIEADPYKKAEMFVGYMQRAVNGDFYNFHVFVQILQENGQAQIATRLRVELKHSIRSVSLSTSNSTDEGLQAVKIVPEELIEELGDLRVGFAELIYSYEKELRSSPEAQEEFVLFLPRLFRKAVEERSFQAHFDALVEEEVSLFNIFYLKRICGIFPEDIRATTRQLVEKYERQRQHFMASTTVSQFKLLFPASATPSTLLIGKAPVRLKLKNDWGSETIEDLTKLVINFGVSGNHFHLSKVEDGCIAVTWLCSMIEFKLLKIAVMEATDLFPTLGVLQIFIGEELVLECSLPESAATVNKVKQLEGTSEDDLPQNSRLEEQLVPSEHMKLLQTTEAPKLAIVHLAHETDIDYLCPICTEPLTEPHLSIECGHHICRQCRDRLLGISKTECPTCREPDSLVNAVLDKNVQRKVKSLKVRCSNYEEGCSWVGELRHLCDHLKGQCITACPFGCGKYAHKKAMRKHTFHCYKRMISCENCGYYNTVTIVTDKHYPVCPQSPINCPNHCPVEGLKRYQLQKHLNECSHEMLDCPNRKGFPGCFVRLPRRKMILHTLQQHGLVLEETNQAVVITPATVSPQYMYNQAPMEFIINDFHEKKENNEEWSLSFYTHNRGYKLCLKVFTNGYGDGKGSHLSVNATLMRGDYDSELEWPFEGDIRIELLNWNEDKNHHSDLIPFNRYYDLYCNLCYRVTDQEIATRNVGEPRFVSHTDLVLISNTRYLLDDYFKLRVSVAVYSTPLHLIPTWQGLTTAKPITSEFTITEYSVRKLFNNTYFSPPFTNQQGYQFFLRVDANGVLSGKGSHLSMYAYIMKGQDDDRLQWPFSGIVIIELVNWLEDKGHYKKSASLSNFYRVIEGDGNATGYEQFISQSSLSLDSSTNTQYLYKDCIRVRVQVIANA